MTAQPAPSNHPVFLLSEHLDAVLAGCEDIIACEPPLAEVNAQHIGATPRLSLHRFARMLQRHETITLLHVARARELTRELVARDNRFAMLGGLFVGGTAALGDAMREVADTDAANFAHGGDPIGYLGARGVVDVDAGAIVPGAPPATSDGFLLAGAIEIGPLMDLTATFLNTIELHFDLFPDLMEPGETLSPRRLSDLVV